MNVSPILPISILAALTSLAGVACSSSTKPATGSDEALGTADAALTVDNDDSQEAEDAMEDGVENGLSGATVADPGTPADATDLAVFDVKMKLNSGLYFQPAGCIVSTRVAPGEWNHVFTNCTGPEGHVSYNGTVHSKWTVSADALSVVHDASGFVVKGPNVTATASGSRTVTYSRAGAVFTKHRIGAWSGTLAKSSDPTKSAAWSHDADFTSTWDVSSRCYTRDGKASNTIGGRDFGRSVTGFKVCGGLFACPTGGEIVVNRKDGSSTLTITFMGGDNVEITRPSGKVVDRKLACITK